MQETERTEREEHGHTLRIGMSGFLKAIANRAFLNTNTICTWSLCYPVLKAKENTVDVVVGQILLYGDRADVGRGLLWAVACQIAALGKQGPSWVYCRPEGNNSTASFSDWCGSGRQVNNE